MTTITLPVVDWQNIITIAKRATAYLFRKYSATTQDTIYGVASEDIFQQACYELTKAITKNPELEEAVLYTIATRSLTKYIMKESKHYFINANPTILTTNHWTLEKIKKLILQNLNNQPTPKIFQEAWNAQNQNNQQLIIKTLQTPNECTTSEKKQSYRPLNYILDYITYRDRDDNG